MKCLIVIMFVLLLSGWGDSEGDSHFSSLFSDEEHFELSEIIQIEQDRFSLAVNLVRMEKAHIELSKEEQRNCWSKGIEKLSNKIQKIVLADYDNLKNDKERIIWLNHNANIAFIMLDKLSLKKNETKTH